MVHLGRVVVVERLGDGAALGDGHRGQVDPIGHIADRVDVRYLRRALPFVDDDRTIRGEFDPELGEPKRLGIGRTAGRIHDQISVDPFTRGGGNGIAVSALVDARDVRAAADVDAAPPHLLAEIDADVLVEPAQYLRAPDELDDLASEAIEDAGELDRDIAAADDDDALRQVRPVERFVGRDHMLDAGDRRGLGPAAGRDQDVLRRVALAVDLDGVRIDDHAAPVDDLHLRVVQHVDVDL